MPVLCAAPLRASDWYVDAVHGNNANIGTSELTAWRTVTHALASVPPVVPFESHIIHVASGIYDAGLGEQFPLEIERGFEVRGMLDRSSVIDGSAAAVTLVRFGQGSDPGHNMDVAVLEHFLLRSAARGVDVLGTNPSRSASLRNLEVTGMSGDGIAMTAGPSDVNLQLDGLDVHDNLGRAFNGGAVGSVGTLLVDDCHFSRSSVGVALWAGPGGIESVFRRCRIAQNIGDGFSASAGLGMSGVHVTIEDSSIVDNGACGWVGGGSAAGSWTWASFSRCTIAGNASAGVLGSGPFPTRAELSGCILWGNVDDIAHPAARIRYCDIEDGDGAGFHGNFSLDPLFVDPSQGDYRLAWASPCIETGDSGTASGTLDLARNARPIDGDLDTIERFDIGAFEFAPLFTPSTGALGSALILELWGPQGNATKVYFTKGGFVAPLATRFGELDLDPASMGVYRITTVGAGPPRVLSRRLPSDPAWIGATLSFQALTDCAAAPQGRAYTNAVQITLTP